METNSSNCSSGSSRLLVVDGHAYAHRSFHAIARLNAPDGSPTNAIFGFIKALARLIEAVKPEFVAVAWDGGLAEERLRELPEYKAQRPPMADALRVQFDGMNAWLDASGLFWFLGEGVEADDWIASLAHAASGQGTRVVIASSDKDFLQLVSPQVGILNPADKSQTVWGESEVIGKTGVKPSQVVDWLSLVGDTVDNIPGVRGVGPKTAADLMRQFGSVDALYAAVDQAGSDRLVKALQEAEPLVRRNQRLIRLKSDLPGVPELEKLRPGAPNVGEQKRLCERWGFRSLMPSETVAENRQGLLF